MSFPIGGAQRILQYSQNLTSQLSRGVVLPDGGTRGPAGALGSLAAGGEGALRSVSPSGGPSFGETLKQALGEVSDAQDAAEQQVGAFLRGEPVELHQVMAATEEAGIALEMLVEIRNKFTEAYRTVINMQS